MRKYLSIIAYATIALCAHASDFQEWPETSTKEVTAAKITYTCGNEERIVIAYQMPNGSQPGRQWFTRILLLQPTEQEMPRTIVNGGFSSKQWESSESISPEDWQAIDRASLKSAINTPDRYTRNVSIGKVTVISRKNPDEKRLHSSGGTSEVHEIRNSKGELFAIAESEMLLID